MNPAGLDPRRVVEIEGPWEHRYVAAQGARFHVVAAGPDGSERPPIVLLHGFPHFWWAWRHQVSALAEAGHRVYAMDLRGYGGSDKTPRGYDPITLAADVAGVAAGLGEREVVVAGHGWGGYIAWTTAVAHPDRVRAVLSIGAPHPRAMLRSWWRQRPAALGHVLAMQVPLLPERRIARPGFVQRHLRTWAAPGSSYPSPAEVRTYAAALSLWPASHCALEYHRWLLRSRWRADGRAFRRLLAAPVAQPSCLIMGDHDPALPGRDSSRRWVTGPFTSVVIPGCGHFPPEERPDQVGAAMLDWLDRL